MDVVRNYRSEVSRRKVLKWTGSTVGGVSIFGSSVAASDGLVWDDTGGPKYENNGSLGYIKATPQNPVSTDTVREIQDALLDNRPDSVGDSGIVMHDPESEAEKYARKGNPKNIIGYAIKWRNGAPDIKICYAPKVDGVHAPRPTSQDNIDVLNRMTKNAHSKIDRFISGGE